MQPATQHAFSTLWPSSQPQHVYHLARGGLPKRGGHEEGKWLRNLLRARAARKEFFKADLFSDPAWDMLLELYTAEVEQRRISISGLADATGVPGTTSLRWIAALQKQGLISREADPFDGRRVFVTLTPGGLHAIRSYLDSLPPSLYPFSA